MAFCRACRHWRHSSRVFCRILRPWCHIHSWFRLHCEGSSGNKDGWYIYDIRLIDDWLIVDVLQKDIWDLLLESLCVWISESLFGSLFYRALCISSALCPSQSGRMRNGVEHSVLPNIYSALPSCSMQDTQTIRYKQWQVKRCAIKLETLGGLQLHNVNMTLKIPKCYTGIY